MPYHIMPWRNTTYEDLFFMSTWKRSYWHEKKLLTWNERSMVLRPNPPFTYLMEPLGLESAGGGLAMGPRNRPKMEPKMGPIFGGLGHENSMNSKGFWAFGALGGDHFGSDFGSILGLRAAGPGPGMGCEILGPGLAINSTMLLVDLFFHVGILSFHVDMKKRSSYHNIT